MGGRRPIILAQPPLPLAWTDNPDPDAALEAFHESWRKLLVLLPPEERPATSTTDSGRLQFEGNPALGRISLVRSEHGAVMVKGVVPGSQDDVAARADGWKPFVPEARAYKYGPLGMVDLRKCEQPSDYLDTNDERWRDTPLMFPIASHNLHLCYGDQKWRPGFPIWKEKGWEPSDEEARASVAMYKPQHDGDPKYMTDSAAGESNVLTNCGFLFHNRRPERAPLGWGDFDQRHEWQCQGRVVKNSMIEERHFRMDDTGSTTYVSDPVPGRPQRTEVTTAALLGEDAPPAPAQTRTFKDLVEAKERRSRNRAVFGNPEGQRGGGRGSVARGGWGTQRGAGGQPGRGGQPGGGGPTGRGSQAGRGGQGQRGGGWAGWGSAVRGARGGSQVRLSLAGATSRSSLSGVILALLFRCSEALLSAGFRGSRRSQE
jgi:hypothetical protein